MGGEGGKGEEREGAGTGSACPGKAKAALVVGTHSEQWERPMGGWLGLQIPTC